MTFSSTMDRPKQKGTEWEQRGTFTNDVADSGGDVSIAINYCTSFDIQPTGSDTLDKECVVDDTYPITGKSVSILTPAGVDGVWIAKGRMRIR